MRLAPVLVLSLLLVPQAAPPPATEVGDVASAGLTKITRLAASPDGKWLALVAEPLKSEETTGK
jgi:hypothetical protein